ncbi:hypothetical protein KP22_16805 [Pectobacterium betavasculorum]|uniref:DUF2326 domain-containing protein n=1 Tax=Pectobacterium betavasculorum TaxID=55207 RepID=A0A093RIX3_9GAMM|nr:DUF2326 domain-containing protein [Pectobacterium betavasculorum]KFX03067.1 hypothetical protein KP22_16805 [Pectobacterium betavasculorum]
MFLKELIVKSPYLGEIRKVLFHKGVNLILDKSTTDLSGTGNSVGKTTVLRSLDFCMGAKQESFYTDPEFKTTNALIKSFLIDNEVEFNLTLTSSKGDELTIIRKALPEPKVFCKINDNEYSNLKAFCQDLKIALFFSSADKPSLRQIMSRIIRDTSDKMSNTLKTLYNKSSGAEYETLNLFIFGFENPSILSEKQIINRKLKKLESELAILTKIKSKNSLEQSLEIINRDIDERNSAIENYDLGESYDSQMRELNAIKLEVSALSLDLASLNMKKSLNLQAIEELLQQKDNSDPNDLKALYLEATNRVEKLTKTFEDALNFHNQMIFKKVEFIESQMDGLNEKINIKGVLLASWLTKESSILKELSSLGSLSDLQLLQKELNKLYESKGSFESSLEQIKSYEEKTSNLTEKIKEISIKIEKEIDNFDNNIKIFNKYFSIYTRKLYEEEFILTFSEKNGVYDFKIDPVGVVNSKGNLGDGKKKAQVSALDLAYLALQAEINSKSVRFVAHDGIEAIHPNQIRVLFDIASSIDGQYILAILSDKLSSIEKSFIKEHTILELSEDNKFFKC